MLSETQTATKVYPYRISNGKSNDGMWVVHENSDQYRAWEYWLHHEIGKNSFPKPVMVVWFEWPPSTQVFADRVAQAISDIRDGEDSSAPKHRDGSKPPIGGAPVPRHPQPWGGYIPDPPVEERLISHDVMREIRLRLVGNFVGPKQKVERTEPDQTPLSAALRNRLGVNAPERP